MRMVSLVLIAAVEIGGAFGSATAEVESIDSESMIVDLRLEVRTSAEAVIAHLTFEDDPPSAIPLLDRGNGVFGITTELEAKNYIVVFEVIGPSPATSDPISLMRMGADLTSPTVGDDSPGSPTTVPDEGLSAQTRRLGWLAVALTAGSLSALAIWVLGGSDEKDTSDTTGITRGGDGV